MYKFHSTLLSGEYKISNLDFLFFFFFFGILVVETFSFSQVTTLGEDDGSDDVTVDVVSSIGDEIVGGEVNAVASEEEEESTDLIEIVHVSEDYFYMQHIVKLAAVLHTLVSLAMLIAYYHLKASMIFHYDFC